MKTIKNQANAGTRLDSQGERNSKEVLLALARQYAEKRMPLNQNHDFSLPVLGFAENLRVVPDESSPGEWRLIGDVQFDGDALDIPFGGFSISFIEILRKSQSQELFHVYLPFPYYNDHELIDEIFEEGFVSVGRWAKKAADPTSIALIGGIVALILKPVWDDVYKTQIAPHVYKFFSEKFSKLEEKNISADFVQHVVYNHNEIQVTLIPCRGQEEQCFNIEETNAAIECVHSYLTSQVPLETPPRKIFLRYDEETCKYVLHRIENQDGSS